MDVIHYTKDVIMSKLNISTTGKPNRRKCVVLSCVNHRTDSEERVFFFPRNKEIAEEWIRFANNPKLKIEDAAVCASKGWVLCHRHFATHQFQTPQRLRLNRKSIPTIFSPLDNQDYYRSPEITSARSLEINSNAKKQVNRIVTKIGNNSTGDNQLLDESTIVFADPHTPEIQSSSYYEVEILHPNPFQVYEEEIIQSTSASDTGGDIDIKRENVMTNENCSTDNDNYVTNEESDRFSGDFLLNISTWEYLPNELCRLCASTDDHPKQSITGWMNLLKEVIPAIVSLNDGLPQYICKPCTNKLYTCGKIKQEFYAAYRQLCIALNKVTEDFQTDNFPGSLKRKQEYIASECHTNNTVRDSHKNEDIRHELEDCIHNNEQEVESECLDETTCQTSENELSGYESTSEFTDGKNKRKLRYAFVCCHCECLFHSKRLLKRHKNTVHESLTCEFCNKNFLDEKLLKEHKILHDSEGLFRCEICKFGCRSHQGLINHRLTHLPPKHLCCSCGRKFRTRYALKSHQIVHNIDLQVMCDFCGKRVKDKKTLQVHMRLHTGEKPFQCHVCGKRFSSSNALYVHGFKHREPAFSCNFCGKRFHKMCSLKTHLETHTRKRPYKCPVCFLPFTKSQNRDRHLRMPCKTIICVVCRLTFTSTDALITHRADEHTEEEIATGASIYRNERIIHCSVCSLGINGYINLRRHMRVRHGFHRENNNVPKKKPTSESSVGFVCCQCEKVFTSKKNLHRHETSVHQSSYLISCSNCQKDFKELNELLAHECEHNIIAFIC